MAAATAKFYFRFRFGCRRPFQNVSRYQQTKFDRNISIRGWDINIFGLEKQTSAILEFYFRFQFRQHHHNRHALLHQDAKCHPHRAILHGVMMLEPIFKMAAAATAQMYFRFRIGWLRSFQNVSRYQQTKFGRNISIRGWDITISASEK